METENIPSNTYESNPTPLQSLLNCTMHSYSFYIEGNINNVSIIQEMCSIYNTLFKLNFSFTNSLNKQYSNFVMADLPLIYYEGLQIKRNSLNYFLKNLVKLDQFRYPGDNIETSRNVEFQIEILEKIILSDLQSALNFYNYFHDNEKTKYLWKFIKFLYQPFVMLKSSLKERKIIKEITRQLGISTKYEALEYIKGIYKKIENFITSLGQDYCSNLQNREINAIDVLSYSAVKAVNRIISRNKSERYGLNSFKNLETLCRNFDYMILNQIPVKNKFQLLTKAEFNLENKKTNFINTNFFPFSKYSDTININDDKNLRIRKSFLSCFFFGSLLLLSIVYNKNKL